MPLPAEHNTIGAQAVAARAISEPREFDGVLCFGGEDWWYHNRGHFDMQMMREFSAHVPVLYVNSIGMRMPSVSEGRMFAARMCRKIRSITRGLHRVNANFSVYSPLVAPTGLPHRLTMPMLPAQIRTAARTQRIRKPLLWIACPTAAPIVDRFAGTPLVYQRTDMYECFKGVGRERIRQCDAFLKARADLTVFCSPTLLALEAEQCKNAALIGHGVDVARFAGIADDDSWQPADIRNLPTPRVGFVGGIDAHTFDPDLFNAVAAQIPEAHFVLVGGCSLPAGWCTSANVSKLGRKPFEHVHEYMRACDVLIMPWKRNEWIDACNPVKFKEYLATGRPIVSTPFGALQRYKNLVHVADTAEQFANAVRHALNEPGSAAARRFAVRDESWKSKADCVLRRLAGAGIKTTDNAHAAGVPRIGSLAHVASVEVKPLPAAPLRPHTVIDAPNTQSPQRQLRKSPTSTSQELAGCILLAGGMRLSPLIAATGCSILDLWLTAESTVLDCWLQRLRSLPGVVDKRIPLRVVSSPAMPAMWPQSTTDLDITFELEPRAFRGTAGLLHDLCRGYPADAHVLVVEAARYVACDLTPLWRSHARSGADITIACNGDGSLAGMYIVRCSSLHSVSQIGYTDFKEQFLVQAAQRDLLVRTVPLPGRGALPLRCRTDLLEAAAEASGANDPYNRVAVSTGVLPSEGCYGLQILCPGATLAEDATLVDSILMPGATVASGACVVRCVVCCGCIVQAGADIADAVIGPHGQSTDRAANMPSGQLYCTAEQTGQSFAV